MRRKRAVRRVVGAAGNRRVDRVVPVVLAGARACTHRVALRDLVRQEHNPLRYRERPSDALEAGHPAHMKCPSAGAVI